MAGLGGVALFPSQDMQETVVIVKHAATTLVVLVLALLASCASQGSALRTNAGPTYPRTLENAGALPIQVIRRVTHIDIANTSPRSFGASTVWLNGRFSHPLDALAVGQTLRLDLREFRDEFGEAFRAGGFFATRNPEALVLCELETEGRMYGLIVVGSLID